jgi:hypothetical protein
VDFYSCIKGLSEGTNLKYKAELRHILMTHGSAKVTDWVCTHGTFFEVVWWKNHLREADTGQRLTNAQQKALWGHDITNAIRVAGHRLKEKLVKAFLGTELE